MFESTFRDLFRAVDRIESNLSHSDAGQKALLAEELSLLRAACDQYVEKWLQFDERITQLCDRFGLRLEQDGGSLEWAAKWISDSKPAGSSLSSLPENGSESAEELLASGGACDYWVKALANEDVAESFRFGLGYFDLLLFDQSIEQMERVIALSPDLTIARVYLALGYLAKGQHEKCQQHLQFVAAVESDPLLQATVCAARAQIAARDDQYEEALQYFQAALKFEPQFKDVHYNVGVCHWHRQNYRAAIKALEQALEKDKRDWQALQLIGRCYIRMGRLEQAAVFLDKARQLNPAYPPLLLNLADVFQMLGRNVEAAHLYERILQADPQFAPALSGLGWIRLQEGRNEEALAIFSRQQQAETTCEAAYNLACAYLAKGDLEQAASLFRTLKHQGEWSPFVSFGLSRVYLRMGKFEQARDEVTDYLDSPVRDIRAIAFLCLARVYFEWGELTRAIRYCKLSLLVKPKLPNTAFLLGVCYTKAGNEPEARKWLSHGRQLAKETVAYQAGNRRPETELLH